MTREQVEALAGELNGCVDVQVHGPRAFVITGTELRRIQGLCGRADDALRSLLAERDALRKAADELVAAINLQRYANQRLITVAIEDRTESLEAVLSQARGLGSI